MRLLFIGDVVGKPGRECLAVVMPRLREQHKPDLVVVNGENSAGGVGITEETGGELFSPGFLDWTTRLPAEVDFGITDSQLFFHWRLRELTRDELEQALKGAGGIFEQLRREMVEDGIATFQIGPWYAGMEPFPPAPGRT